MSDFNLLASAIADLCNDGNVPLGEIVSTSDILTALPTDVARMFETPTALRLAMTKFDTLLNVHGFTFSRPSAHVWKFKKIEPSESSTVPNPVIGIQQQLDRIEETLDATNQTAQHNRETADTNYSVLATGIADILKMVKHINISTAKRDDMGSLADLALDLDAKAVKTSELVMDQLSKADAWKAELRAMTKHANNAVAGMQIGLDSHIAATAKHQDWLYSATIQHHENYMGGLGVVEGNIKQHFSNLVEGIGRPLSNPLASMSQAKYKRSSPHSKVDIVKTGNITTFRGLAHSGRTTEMLHYLVNRRIGIANQILYISNGVSPDKMWKDVNDTSRQMGLDNLPHGNVKCISINYNVPYGSEDLADIIRRHSNYIVFFDIPMSPYSNLLWWDANFHDREVYITEPFI